MSEVFIEKQLNKTPKKLLSSLLYIGAIRFEATPPCCILFPFKKPSKEWQRFAPPLFAWALAI